jgi:hypothetical protein
MASQVTVQELLEEREIVYRNLLSAYLKLQDVNREKAELEMRLQQITVTPAEPVDKRCKLTAQQVNEMRQAYTNKVSMHQLAKRYGVTVSTVWKIVHEHSWKPPVR